MWLVWWRGWGTYLTRREGIKKRTPHFGKEWDWCVNRLKKIYSGGPLAGEAEKCLLSPSRHLSLELGTKALAGKPRGIHALTWKTDACVEFGEHWLAIEKVGLGWYSGFSKVSSFFQRVGAEASRGVLPLLHFGRVTRTWHVLKTHYKEKL